MYFIDITNYLLLIYCILFYHLKKMKYFFLSDINKKRSQKCTYIILFDIVIEIRSTFVKRRIKLLFIQYFLTRLHQHILSEK